MPIVAGVIFVALLIASNAFIVETTGVLPERIASHFGGNNLPNGWMTRGGYLVFMLAFAGFMPVALTALIGGLARVFPEKMNVPHRDYWLAPARRDETVAFLTAHALWFGSLLTVFVAGVHYTILQAHLSTPPRLPGDVFWALLSAFLAALALWIGVLYMRFRSAG